MPSSLSFFPPISSPPWPLISSKISSVAFLCGIPQGAAGPERGVEIPNLMMSAAPAVPGLPGISTAAARSAVDVTERHGFIAIPPGCWALSRWPGTRTIETRIVGCQSHRRRVRKNERRACWSRFRFSLLPDPAELPEAPQVPRRSHVAAPDGESHVAHVEITIRVHGDTMWRDELARPFSFFRRAETRLQSALEVVHAHAMAQPRSVIHSPHAVQLTDEEVPFRVQTDAVWPVDVVPHGDEFTVGIEHLDAMGLPVGHVDVIIPVDDHIVRPDELARIDAGLAPRQDEPALGGEFVDAAVAISVRDVEVPGDAGHRHVGGPVEGLALPLGCWLVGAAQGHQQLAIQGELLDGMESIIHAVDRVVGAGVDPVRPLAEQALAKRSQDVAITIEDDDRMFTPVEDVHVVLAVHRDASYVDERPPFRELLPALHRFEHQGATAESHGHFATPPLLASG